MQQSPKSKVQNTQGLASTMIHPLGMSMEFSHPVLFSPGTNDLYDLGKKSVALCIHALSTLKVENEFVSTGESMVGVRKSTFTMKIKT